jgi:prevent-host-death family protein
MPIQIDVREAKTRLSQILAQVEQGEDVVITRDGTPIARLVPVADPPPRPVGFVAGTLSDASLPEDELARWA